jgi:hypothetical protein
VRNFISNHFIREDAIKKCQNELTFWSQNIGTCWFDVLLMVTFYSEFTKKLVKQETKYWNTKKHKPLHLFLHVLNHKQVKTKERKKDIAFFNKYTPEYILKLLHHDNPQRFFLSDFERGFNTVYYIKAFYDYLGLTTVMLTIVKDTIFYDLNNEIANIIILNGKYFPNYTKLNYDTLSYRLSIKPDILVVNINDENNPGTSYLYDLYKKQHPYYVVDTADIDTILTTPKYMIYNDQTYALDAIILANKNYSVEGHYIAGITCGKSRYVYNSWRLQDNKYTDDLLSCKLIPFDWDTNNSEFCMSPDCGLQSPIDTEQCFAFNEGERLLIYVKINATSIKSSTPINEIISVSPTASSRPSYKSYNESRTISPHKA